VVTCTQISSFQRQYCEQLELTHLARSSEKVVTARPIKFLSLNITHIRSARFCNGKVLRILLLIIGCGGLDRLAAHFILSPPSLPHITTTALPTMKTTQINQCDQKEAAREHGTPLEGFVFPSV